MRTVTRRIGKLEDTFRPGNGKPLLLLVVTAAEKRLALDQDRCTQILGECGFLPTGVPVGVVNLAVIPHGLDAGELERFLREHGAETRGINGAQNHGGQAGTSGKKELMR
jgi:hypothetical protein